MQIQSSFYHTSTMGHGEDCTTFPKVIGPICVVGPQFVCSQYLDMFTGKKLSDGIFGVTDVNGNLMFKIIGKSLSLHGRRILVDAAGNRILTFQKKLTSPRKTWLCFRGDNTDYRHYLFTVKQSNGAQYKTLLDVFLASNRNQDVADFKVRGNWLEKRCAVFAGESTATAAEMNKNHNVLTLCGEDAYIVKVYPNVDCAFIVALMVILNEIYEV